MEEDIKILEEFAHDLMQDYIYSKDEIPKSDIRLKDAIENIIAKYKELEENQIWSEATIEGLKKEFIPKSKVQEKIEELKNGTYDAKIILQQFLED